MEQIQSLTNKELKEERKYLKRYTPARIAILGMLLALLITLKYVFGFVLGIEFVSFMFVMFGILLPVVDIFVMVTAFNLLVLALYGFGTWWLVYWIIWPVDALVSKVLSKITNNRYVFAFWAFIAGLSVFFWYFLSDLLIFGTGYAVLNVITAIPINTIEGITTMLSILTIGPLMMKVFSQYRHKFWPLLKPWDFSPIKRQKFTKVFITFVVLLGIAIITLLFIYNQWFLDLKFNLTPGKGDQGELT